MFSLPLSRSYRKHFLISLLTTLSILGSGLTSSSLSRSNQDQNKNIVVLLSTGNIAGIQQILTQKPNLYELDNKGNNALHILAQLLQNHTIQHPDAYKIAQLLISYDKSLVTSPNKQGHTPLFIVAKNNTPGIVYFAELFLTLGADPNNKEAGSSPFTEALRTNCAADTIAAFVKHGGNLNKKTTNNMSNLSEAINVLRKEGCFASESPNIIKVLLQSPTLSYQTVFKTLQELNNTSIADLKPWLVNDYYEIQKLLAKWLVDHPQPLPGPLWPLYRK